MSSPTKMSSAKIFFEIFLDIVFGCGRVWLFRFSGFLVFRFSGVKGVSLCGSECYRVGKVFRFSGLKETAMAWFTGGFDKAQEAAEEAKKDNLHRFFVKVGESRSVYFLDDFDWKVESEGMERAVVPFCLWEHKLTVGNHSDAWKNPRFVTCVQGSGKPCKCCDAGFRRQFVGAMTILDITPYKGEARAYKRLLVGVSDALAVLEAKREKRGNLKNALYSIARHTKKQPRVGSDFELESTFEGNLAEEYPDLDLAPYGLSAEDALKYYIDLFEPPTYEELESLFERTTVSDGFDFKGRSNNSGGNSGGGNSGGNSGGDGGGSTDETIPF